MCVFLISLTLVAIAEIRFSQVKKTFQYYHHRQIRRLKTRSKFSYWSNIFTVSFVRITKSSLFPIFYPQKLTFLTKLNVSSVTLLSNAFYFLKPCLKNRFTIFTRTNLQPALTLLIYLEVRNYHFY